MHMHMQANFTGLAAWLVLSNPQQQATTFNGTVISCSTLLFRVMGEQLQPGTLLTPQVFVGSQTQPLKWASLPVSGLVNRPSLLLAAAIHTCMPTRFFASAMIPLLPGTQPEPPLPPCPAQVQLSVLAAPLVQLTSPSATCACDSPVAQLGVQLLGASPVEAVVEVLLHAGEDVAQVGSRGLPIQQCSLAHLD